MTASFKAKFVFSRNVTFFLIDIYGIDELFLLIDLSLFVIRSLKEVSRITVMKSVDNNFLINYDNNP